MEFTNGNIGVNTFFLQNSIADEAATGHKEHMSL
jgi:hypothetical protein